MYGAFLPKKHDPVMMNVPEQQTHNATSYHANGWVQLVVIPAALGALGFLGVTVMVLCIVLAAKLPAGWLWAAPIVGVPVFLAVVFLAVKQGINLLEIIIGKDLNHDKTIGGIRPVNPEVINVNFKDDTGYANKMDYTHIPNHPGLNTFFQALYNGRETSMGTWAGGVGSGKLFKRSEYEGIRNALFEYGYAVKTNPEQSNSPWTVTKAGRAAIKAILKSRGVHVEDKLPDGFVPLPHPTEGMQSYATDTLAYTHTAHTPKPMMHVERGVDQKVRGKR